MEVKQDEMTEEKWQEMKQIAKANVCAECGADLQVHTVPERAVIRIGCLNQDHHGYVERETYTQAMRRGEEIHPAIRDAVEKKMLPRDELGRAMNLLALRYPTAIQDPATAALFIMDCARLDLDPLISPPEAVPVTFKSRHKKGAKEEEKVTVVMIITGDGWLSMAARGCEDSWVGPPRTMLLEDYLTTLTENKGKTKEEVKELAQAIKFSDCKDKEAWYYVAIGRRRDGDETAVPGWFTHADFKNAEEKKLPAATLPGNQARVRAIKKWVRQVFPECRQKMIALTKEWYQRSEGIKDAQEYIDAEYQLISISPKGDEKLGTKEGERGGEEKPAATSLSSQKGEKKGKSRGAAPPAAERTEGKIEGEGFSIDLTWLNEALEALKWSEETAKSWLSKYKIDTSGPLTQVLTRLNREQAEEFVKEIQDKVAQKQMQLFE